MLDVVTDANEAARGPTAAESHARRDEIQRQQEATELGHSAEHSGNHKCAEKEEANTSPGTEFGRCPRKRKPATTDEATAAPRDKLRGKPARAEEQKIVEKTRSGKTITQNIQAKDIIEDIKEKTKDKEKTHVSE